MIVAASFDTSDPALWVNRAMQYGDGLFETMRMRAGRIGLWPGHQRRLSHGLSVLGLSGLDWALVEQQLQHFGTQHAKSDWVLKLMVFRAAQPRSYRPMTAAADWLITAERCQAVAVGHALKLAVAEMRLSTQPVLAGIKHLSRLEQVLVAKELDQHVGIDDLLLLDQRGQVIETTHQNVLLIKQQQLYTPKLDGCGVEGVALQWLKQQQTVTEVRLGLSDLADFDGMLVCNAVRGFRAVSTVDGINSFITSHAIHDKINGHWAVFDES